MRYSKIRIVAMSAMTLFLMNLLPAACAASVLATVNLSQQRMEVIVDGVKRYSWQVSTGKEGWRTRPGSYTPFALTPYYYSKRWNMPLTYLISIDEDGTAIHGTTHTDRLGRPASHGCIRLDTNNAAILYHLIETHGMWSTQIIVIR
jgi:lipoprotein-anchoring transpeptidase ErfK/SrfK